MEIFVVFVVLSLILSYWTGVMAKRKGKSFVLWSILQLLFYFPIILIAFHSPIDPIEKKRQQDAYWKERFKEMDQLRSKQKKIICKLCGEKGGVTSRSHVEKDETREKGFIGATIGRKTVTKRNVRKYSCSNCGESWILG